MCGCSGCLGIVGGVSLLSNRSYLQCVVDNHTLDDNLCNEGWVVATRALTNQRGFHRQCIAFSCAQWERKGRKNMVREEDCGACTTTREAFGEDWLQDLC